MSMNRDDRMYVLGVREKQLEPDLIRLDFRTTRGSFQALYQPAVNPSKAVVFISGEEGGFEGPGLLYANLGKTLQDNNIASLRLNCRIPGNVAQCGVDTFLALQFLDEEYIKNIALVGWSLGGAVALNVAPFAKNVRAIAALSTQPVSDDCIRRLATKPLLLLHGELDKKNSLQVPRYIASQAVSPHRMIVYANADHNFEGVQDKLCVDLSKWLMRWLKRRSDGKNHIPQVA